jgi:uncharacterized repeat protein (TIGR04076 family)
MTTYNLKVTVTEIRGKGHCEYGIKKGDTFLLDDDTKGVPCMYANSAIFPFISGMRYGAAFPWEPDPNVGYACCPDPYNTVVFKIERV